MNTGEREQGGPGHRKRITTHQGCTPVSQEPSGPGHRTPSKTHQACTPVNRSQVALDTAHETQHVERTHPCTGAKWRRTPHTQHNTPSVHTCEQKPSGPGHCTHSTKHGACTPVNRSQVAQETAHASQEAERTHRCTAANWLRTPYTQHNTPSLRTDEQEPSGQGHGTQSTTHRVYTLLNSSKVAGENTHATQHAKRPLRSTGAMWPR